MQFLIGARKFWQFMREKVSSIVIARPIMFETREKSCTGGGKNIYYAGRFQRSETTDRSTIKTEFHCTVTFPLIWPV